MEQLPANEDGSQQEEGLVEGIVAFVADQQTAVTVQPGEGAFDYPPIATSFSLDSMPRRAMRGMMCRWRSKARFFRES